MDAETWGSLRDVAGRHDFTAAIHKGFHEPHVIAEARRPDLDLLRVQVGIR